MTKNKENKTNNIIKILFIVASIMFAIPSIVYIINNKTVLKFEPYFKFLLNESNRVSQTLIYIIILTALTVCYFVVLKNREKIFKNTKRMFIFIAIISLIFVFVVPFTCSDIFYYLGVGRLDSTYHQNPYYTTIKGFVEQGDNIQYLQNDSVLEQGYNNDWADSTVVYGALWTLICRIVAGISFGNIDFALILFKLINVCVHLLNCYLIYKISHKKIFTLIYGLNPFILIEGIACVHNDMFVALFILLAMYFLVKKKKIALSVVFIAMASAIKYFAIIILPFIVIYHYQHEKPLKRIYRCIQYGLLFLIIFALPYLFYIQDFNVLKGILTQQEKIAKSFYIIILEYFTEPSGLVTIVNKFLLEIFVIIYFFTCIVLLNKKEIKLSQEIRKANYFIMAFLFLLITNFQPWYIIWLFPLIMWQKSEDIKLIIQISLISQFANSIFLTYGEGWKYGTPFTFFMVTGTLLAVIYNNKMKGKLR